MGWRNLKEKYGLEHIVQITKTSVCIGSAYIHNLLIIDPMTGKIIQSTRDFGERTYPELMKADPKEVLALLNSPDPSTESITVFTYNDGDVIEKQCEKLGWPNVTHDGEVMYDNTFSIDKGIVIGWAKRNAALAVKQTREYLVKAEAEVVRQKELLEIEIQAQAKLEADYPEEPGTNEI